MTPRVMGALEAALRGQPTGRRLPRRKPKHKVMVIENLEMLADTGAAYHILCRSECDASCIRKVSEKKLVQTANGTVPLEEEITIYHNDLNKCKK